MGEQLQGLPRAEQIIQKAIEDRTIPDAVVIASSAAHAQAIATIELAKAVERCAIALEHLDRVYTDEQFMKGQNR